MIQNDFVLQNVLRYLSIKDILILEIALSKRLDDSYWKQKAFDIFGEEFWKHAYSRPIRCSMPLDTWKEELLRIEKFQFLVEKTLDYRWTIHDFYMYWDKYDNYLHSNN